MKRLLALRPGVRPAPADLGSPASDTSAPGTLASAELVRSALPAGILVVCVWCVWAWYQGGFAATGWGPPGVFLVLLLGVAALAVPLSTAGWEPRRAVMLLALAAFTAWNFLSMIWAEFPGEAWTGSDKTLLYAAGFALFACFVWTRRSLAIILGVFALGVAVVAGATLVRVVIAANPAELFSFGNLNPPITYTNANTALWMLGFWPAAYLGSAAAVPPALRALFLASASLLLDLAVLGQSRGWAIIAPLVACLYVLLARQRLRALLGVALPAAGTAIILAPLLDVGDAGAGSIGPPADRAAGFILFASVCVGLGAACWALLERRVTLSARAHRTAGIAVLVGLLVLLGAGGAAFATRVDDPGRWIEERWNDFTGREVIEDDSLVGGSLASNRYEEWKIAWFEFRDHPILGLGSDNYAHAYLLRRTSHTDTRYPLSTPLRLLSQLGVVGTALFVVVAGIAVSLALRRRRDEDLLTAGASAAALTVFLYWLFHSSVDWFWEIPALAGPAFGMLALAGARIAGDRRECGDAREDPTPGPRPRPPRLVRAATATVGGLVLLAACAALVFPWAAAEYRQAGASRWVQQPDEAYADLERAADLNPLSADPLLLKGSIALRRRDVDVARDALLRAAEREPLNYYPYFQLGLLEGYRGDYVEAERLVRHALELNPRDSIIGHALREIQRGREIDPDRINALYLGRLNARAGRQIYPDSLTEPGRDAAPLHLPRPRLQ